MTISRKRTLAVLGAVALMVSLAGPAVANPKKVTEKQVQSALLSPEEAAQVTGFTGRVGVMDGFAPTCGPEKRGFMCTTGYASNDMGLRPYFVAVRAYPSAKAAKAAVKTLPGVPEYLKKDGKISRTPINTDVHLDQPAGSRYLDELASVRDHGRFVVTVLCTADNATGTLSNMTPCVVQLGNAQAKKINALQY